MNTEIRSAPSGPLHGTLVADFTRLFAGPSCTQILGDLGANVIKVERVDGGDETRYYGVTEEGSAGPSFLALNRNKSSLALNLSHPAGRDIALRLMDRADVAVHNFRNGVMETLGLDYQTVSKRNPGLVYCAISGFGAVGPLREKAANELIMEAYSGLLSITGEADGPPVRCGTAIADMTTGLYATVGILAALAHRRSGGSGQLVETSLFESQLNLMNYFYVEYWLNGTVMQRMGTANRLGMPNQAFPTKDGWVVLSAVNNKMWTGCCAALGLTNLGRDDRLTSLRGRYLYASEVVAAITAATSQLPTAECIRRLEEAGVVCAPVNTIPDVATDPQLDALGSVVELPIADGRQVKLIRSPLHLSASPTSARTAPPELGQDTDEVLATLGLSRAEIEGLRQAKTIQ
jgi:crotonobetainyl-CoA:carnitine CoA-transferase CaiB-like acyl-CoA transferase